MNTGMTNIHYNPFCSIIGNVEQSLVEKYKGPQGWPCPFAISALAMENSTWLRKSASGEDYQHYKDLRLTAVKRCFRHCHIISRLARAWAIPISHLIIIILDFPSEKSSISFDKQGYDPQQVTLLTRS